MVTNLLILFQVKLKIILGMGWEDSPALTMNMKVSGELISEKEEVDVITLMAIFMMELGFQAEDMEKDSSFTSLERDIKETGTMISGKGKAHSGPKIRHNIVEVLGKTKSMGMEN